MGPNVGLEWKNNWQAEPRPKAIHRSCHDNPQLVRDIKEKPSSRYYHVKSLDVGFTELIPSSSPSPRRKSMPSRPVDMSFKENEVRKRGSVHHSSKEVRRMTKLIEERRNLELAKNDDDAFLSFDIVDSSHRPCQNKVVLLPHQNISPQSLSAEPKYLSSNSPHCIRTGSVDFLDLSFRHLPEEHSDLTSSCLDFSPTKNSSVDNLLDICLHPKDNKCVCPDAAPKLMGRGSHEEEISKSIQVLCPEIEGKLFYERDSPYSLSKSFSVKTGMINSPFQSERGDLKASTKTRFSPLKKMLDPIMKSKSLRSPSLVETESDGLTATAPASNGRIKVFQKPMLNDSNTAQKMKLDGHTIGSDQVSVAAFSPAHLHGTLKLEFKHGAPSFEFLIKDPEDVLLAKTWKTDNEFNWVYTFHSCKKKSNSTGWGTKDRQKRSPPMIAQMHVSCYLCSQLSESGCLDNSMVTEFILYDIAQARRSIVVEEKSHGSSDSIRPPDVYIARSPDTVCSLETSNAVEPEKYGRPFRHALSDCDLDVSTSYPWSPVDLHPHLEIASVVIQIPFSRKELPKDKQVQEMNIKRNLKQSNIDVDQGRNTMSDGMNHASVKVITPSGTHGMPSAEDGGPSSLLHRWRFGGGCDCGGWDMACPLNVFDNLCCGDMASCSTNEGQLPIVLFVQGKKEKIPALSIMADEKGQYSVEFHAQLSALQAFSICIAILHSSEASTLVDQEKSRHRLYSNSLKLLLEEEVRQLIEVVAHKEKKKGKKKAEQIPSPFLLDPPFSPMGRV